MSLPWGRKKANDDPHKQPERLPRRWVTILSTSGGVAVLVCVTSTVPAAVTAGIACVVALHTIME
ncbi:hypothetical protein [Thermomonospora amylolytica]|uniref:hypothetical protein n=1 Tax=Thermomonospora amylolytica TaxID=1411117 RepID=UPI001300ADFA|nr:hypothetical protein [Thermomonospora amylolytica]